jgi:hypothetical protein
LGRLPALSANIRLGWKGLPGKRTIVCYKNSQLIAVKSFITLAPDFIEINAKNRKTFSLKKRIATSDIGAKVEEPMMAKALTSFPSLSM